MADRREHDIGERGDDLLPGAGAGAVPLGGEQRRREIEPGGDVPGRQDVVHGRPARGSALAGDQRKPARRVDRVIDRGGAVAVADQPQQDHVLALCLQAGIIEARQRRQVSQNDARTRTGSGGDRLGESAAFGFVERQRDRALRLVHPGPVEAGAARRDRPAVEVDAAADRVDADHLGAHLRHRHAAERRRDKGADLDDAQIREQPVHRRASVCRVPRLLSRSRGDTATVGGSLATISRTPPRA